jgi:hypothetical protein
MEEQFDARHQAASLWLVVGPPHRRLLHCLGRLPFWGATPLMGIGLMVQQDRITVACPSCRPTTAINTAMLEGMVLMDL